MTKPPKPTKTAKALEVAAKPAEIVGHTLERALDPLASALKRAAFLRVEKQSRQFQAPGSPPAAQGAQRPVRARFRRWPCRFRPFRPSPASNCAGRPGRPLQDRARRPAADAVLRRHDRGGRIHPPRRRLHAPVDWCKRQLEASGGENVRALVVNAGCANSFPGTPGADAGSRVASAAAKRLDCRQRDVMMASTGVIGVLLDDAKITRVLGDVEGAVCRADGWRGGRARRS